jgi:tetrapyrrole methylase family protein/MazG family protein
LVNLGRFLKISSEEALRITISKFSTRFNAMEDRLKKEGKSLTASTLEEMDAVWDEVKKSEKEQSKKQ